MLFGWEMAQRMRDLTVLTEDPNLVSDTHTGSSQPPVTPVPGDLKLSYGFHWHWCADMYADKTPIYIK